MRVEQTEEYRRWIDGLKDTAGRARILMRVDRMIHGNPGDSRNLTHGVTELRIDVGPGYHVYFTKTRQSLNPASGWRRKIYATERYSKAILLAANFKEYPCANL